MGNSFAQESVVWEKTIGNNGNDITVAIAEDNSGNIYALTNTQEDLNFNVTVTRINPNGETVWIQTLPGNKEDLGYDIHINQNNEILVLVSSTSTDIPGITNKGYNDIVLHTLSLNGTLENSHNYGGSFIDLPSKITELSNGNLIITGASRSTDGDLTNNSGQYDAWVIETDPFGELLWQQTIGGTDEDFAVKAIEYGKGDLIILGNSASSTDAFADNKGDFDITLTRLNKYGDILSQKSFGGFYSEEAIDLAMRANGNIIVSAYTFSYNFDVSYNAGGSDLWLLEINPITNDIIWEKTFGTEHNEYPAGIQLANETLTVLATRQIGNSTNEINQDFWLFDLNLKDLTLENEALYGGTNYDDSKALLFTSNQSIVMAGSTRSSDGFVSSKSGQSDGWLLNIKRDQFNDYSVTSIHPNPTVNKIYLNNLPENSTIQVFNANGKKVTEDISLSGVTHSVELGSLPNGIYIVQIASLTRTETHRVMKQ